MQALYAERGFTDLSWATVASYRADPSLNGLSMKQVAEKMVGDGSADAQLEAARTLMLNGGASMVYHFMGEDDIARIMRHPMVSFASDAGVIQPRQRRAASARVRQHRARARASTCASAR